jgi:hypothetical protein
MGTTLCCDLPFARCDLIKREEQAPELAVPLSHWWGTWGRSKKTGRDPWRKKRKEIL